MSFLLTGEQPSISIKLEPSMDSEDRLIESIPGNEVYVFIFLIPKNKLNCTSK